MATSKKNIKTIKNSPAPLWHQKNILTGTLVIISLVFYCNTLLNEYALDDVISITMNSFTKSGFKGIPDLLTKDSFYGFIGSASELSGGRWRPLALVTFATEIQLFGNDHPFISHLGNLLLFVLTAVMMFQLLSKFIFRSALPAFIATLLFVIHPIHTEVVANIKSRDELLSFLFLVLTLYFSLRYFLEGKQISKLLLSILFYFLALLSKENGVTFIAILPVTFYFFTKEKVRNVAVITIPFLVAAGLYMMLRMAVIGFVHKNITEVMNAPYLYATVTQAFATKFYVLGKYMMMLFFPYPLSYDYSYNQIPYTDFSDGKVWLSIIVQGALLIFAFMKLKEKNIFAYGILFYFFSIFIVSNLVVDTGGVMGERFLYQPSFGFCICIAALAQLFFSKITLNNPAKISLAAASLFVVVLLSGYETISRNAEWKNDKILFTTDVMTCPNSARTNNGAGTSFILLSDDVKEDSVKRKALLDSALYHLHRALQIHPEYTDPWLNLGVVYNRLGETYKAEAMWDSARLRNPTHPKLKEFDHVLAKSFYNDALRDGQNKNFAKCINKFYRSLRYSNSDADTWYNLGGAYFTTQRFDSARICFTKALELNPNYEQAAKGLSALNAMQK